MLDGWIEGIKKIDRRTFSIGERLPGIFKEAGLKDMRSEVDAVTTLYTDPRRTINDLKQEIRFQESQFRSRMETDREYVLAGGLKNRQITSYNNQTLKKLRLLLSNDEKLRHDATFSSGVFVLVSGTKI